MTYYLFNAKVVTSCLIIYIKIGGSNMSILEILALVEFGYDTDGTLSVEATILESEA